MPSGRPKSRVQAKRGPKRKTRVDSWEKYPKRKTHNGRIFYFSAAMRAPLDIKHSLKLHKEAGYIVVTKKDSDGNMLIYARKDRRKK